MADFVEFRIVDGWPCTYDDHIHLFPDGTYEDWRDARRSHWGPDRPVKGS